MVKEKQLSIEEIVQFCSQIKNWETSKNRCIREVYIQIVKDFNNIRDNYAVVFSYKKDNRYHLIDSIENIKFKFIIK